MSITAAQNRIQVRAGLKTSVSKKMSSVPTLNPESKAKASTPASSSGASHTIKYEALNALNQQTTRQTLLRSSSQGAYVGGKRNINPSDYKMHNVRDDFGRYADPFKENRRTEMRKATQMADMWARMSKFNAMQQPQQSNGMSTIAMLNQVIGTGAEIAKTIKSVTTPAGSSAPSTSSVVKNSVGSNSSDALSQLRSADSSADIKKGLDALSAEQKKIDADLKTAEDSIKAETKAKTDAEAGLKETDNQIGAEKQNIQKQSGMITKLQSSIQADKMTLASLKSQASSAGALGGAAIQSQISQLEAKIAESERQLQEAQDSKQASEQKISNELEPAKEKYTTTIETATKNLDRAEQDKMKLEVKSKQAEDASQTYTTKLTKSEQAEGKKLSSLQAKLAGYARDYQNEKDASKKEKLAEKYSKEAAEFNEMVKNYSGTDFNEIGTQLS